MQFTLRGIGYLEGAQVVTVTLSAVDKYGVEHPIQAQWPASEVPELAALQRKAIEQVGGDLAFSILEAEEVKAADKVAPIIVDADKDAALAASINDSVKKLLEEREARKRAAAEEARLAEEALKRAQADSEPVEETPVGTKDGNT
jgi:hypothetical protein